jgi:three-Cys-motif partner protein
MVKITDSNPEKWHYPPHTKAKHDILKYYLGGWYPRLSLGGNQRVVFLDGFAGRGRYNNGEVGSPIIALQTLLDHSHWDLMKNHEFVFLFIEADDENAAHLEKVIEEFQEERAPWPTNVKVGVYDSSFEETASGIIEYLAEQKSSLAPTFAFIDPFGFKGMRMEVLANLLNHRACEVFVNFMVMYVNRFLEQEYMGSNMNELFGLDVPAILRDHGGEGRVRYLHDVYKRQLETVAGFDYVQSFAMKNDHGNIEYYLFHGTTHPSGVELMKDAMWKIDPLGTFTFDDREADMDSLFTEPQLGPLRQQLLDTFQGRLSVGTPEIKEFANLRTLFRPPHLTKVMKELERDGVIEVYRPHARAQFGPQVTVTFP